MRIMLAFAGGTGHLDPLVPLAHAARAVGHEVAFAGRPWMTPMVEALGFDAFSAGSDAGLEPVTRPLVEVDMERELRDLREGFVRRIARERATDLGPLFRVWRPDVIVYEETDFGAAIAAEQLGLPHATVEVTASGAFVRCDLLADALGEIRSEHELPPDPGCEMLRRSLVLTPFPPSLRHPDFPPPRTIRGMRTSEPSPRHRRRSVRTATGPRDVGYRPEAPAWATALPDAPRVYATLGTVFNHESGDLFTRILAAVRDLPINVVVTVGRELDPADLGAQPPHVAVARYVPQGEILPHADLVLSHGGSGSVLGALAYGLPMVLVPMGADQPLNAARCEALGVGRTLDTVRATPATIAEAILTVLDAAPMYEAAGLLQAEIAALPGPERAVRLLERLVVEAP
jgi:UDP:flavonoid glycosyltransferase YjiC (YdhE family)